VSARPDLAYDHHNDMLTTYDVIKPTGEQAGPRRTSAAANLIRFRQGHTKAIAELGQRFRVAVSNDWASPANIPSAGGYACRSHIAVAMPQTRVRTPALQIPPRHRAVTASPACPLTATACCVFLALLTTDH
jgi:hypothetical protein